tara:strand:+ start:586 stop:2616 length:2031 start_codon:yes stop_codon:yes gene_type:complete
MKRQMDQNYHDSINILQSQWYEADVDQRFVLGDQEIWSSLFPSTSAMQRKMFNFNLINSMVQMVTGHQRRNRKSSICIPVHDQMQQTADQFTKCLYQVHNQSGAYQVYSDAFEQGALTQGIGLVSIHNDTSIDPSGQITTRYIDFKSVLIDPYFRRSDLTDCRYIWTRQFFDRDEAALLYPKFADEIMKLGNGSYRDDKFYYMPEVNQLQSSNIIAFDEYWYLSSREAEYLVDTSTNEIQEFDGDEEDFRHVQYMTGNRFKLVKKPKQTVRRALLLNDVVLVDEPNPYGIDRYPFVAFLGYFTPDTAYYAYKFRGVVRDMRDAQYLFNRRKVADLDILESQQQGMKVKKGALVRPDDSLNRGNGRVLVIDEKFQMADVEQMQIVPPAPTMIQMEDMLEKITHRITGINDELLGSAIDEKAGVLSMLRQGAGLTTLQRLFDQFDESQKQCGDIMLEMIQKNWTFNKVKEVIGEEPTPEFDNKAFSKYGCKVIQGVLTESQHQLEFQQLLHLYELTGGTNPVILNRAIEVSTIQEKDKLLEKMEQFQQAQAEQENQMKQLQMQQIAVDNETKLAYARSQDGLAKERVAKIKTDMAVAEDKLSRAENEDTASLLNLVKTIKELQSMDTNNLLAKISTLHSINEIEFDKKEELREEANREQIRPKEIPTPQIKDFPANRI